MLVTDTLMMSSLVAFCVGWFMRRGNPVPTWMWLLVATALVASAVGVAQGRNASQHDLSPLRFALLQHWVCFQLQFDRESFVTR